MEKNTKKWLTSLQHQGQVGHRRCVVCGRKPSALRMNLHPFLHPLLLQSRKGGELWYQQTPNIRSTRSNTRDPAYPVRVPRAFTLEEHCGSIVLPKTGPTQTTFATRMVVMPTGNTLEDSPDWRKSVDGKSTSECVAAEQKVER
eukprot:NODE_1989_length_681_cov_6.805054_g1939_i0.p1 GENE.NODE_1989_length_681_cov_6.805054_g1939_i0~~NODE_1989_length_681_cov_6.805054_g1939_i0.p1  ORF type:complete len:144 (+),score=1.28 NODE_1989_length_681_cov_6.805054_g1939_i0:125-556(+)